MSALFHPTDLVVPFENLRMSDVESVGGKNASLGEMISQLPTGVRVPTGFATTAHVFRQFLQHRGPKIIIAPRLDDKIARPPGDLGASLPSQALARVLLSGEVGLRLYHALADQFTTGGMGVGWRGDRFTIRLDGTNLGDARPPVAVSELADASYYLLEARRIWLSFDWLF